MKSLLRLGEANVQYRSTRTVDAKSMPGVRYTILRMSFGRRMELCRQVRTMSQKLEFLQAGNELQETAEANLLSQEIATLYLKFGLTGVHGLTIDGEQPSVEVLIERGPEALCKEIVAEIQGECTLSEAERKN